MGKASAAASSDDGARCGGLVGDGKCGAYGWTSRVGDEKEVEEQEEVGDDSAKERRACKRSCSGFQ